MDDMKVLVQSSHCAPSDAGLGGGREYRLSVATVLCPPLDVLLCVSRAVLPEQLAAECELGAAVLEVALVVGLV